MPRVSDFVNQNWYYIVIFPVLNILLFLFTEYVSSKKIFDEESELKEKHRIEMESLEDSHGIDLKNAEEEIIELNDEINEKERQINELSLAIRDKDSEFGNLTQTIEMYSGIIESNIQKFIFQLFKSLDLDHHDRISLYKRDTISSDFVILTRHSMAEEFKKQNRATYSHNEGFISKCWGATPTFYIDNMDEFPNFDDKENLQSYFEKYYTKNDIIFNLNVLKGITMKSRSYYIRNIYDEAQEKTYGVLVIESIKPKIGNFDNEREITKRLDDDPLIMPYFYYLMNNNLN